MAREEKRYELKPVDDVTRPEVPVIRLESEETLQRAKTMRLGGQPEQAKVSQRLTLPAREDYESRTHQPGIEALIDTEMVSPDFLEQEWGKEAAHHKPIPWGWFVLIGLILAGAAIWSLSGGKKADAKAAKIRIAAASAIGLDEKEEIDAGKLIDRIETTIRHFFDATSVDAVARLARHPGRVKPLMETYYGGKPIPLNRLVRTKQLQPLTLDNRANFWMAAVELSDHTIRNLIVEITADGEPRVDWETLVCHQPMPWDSFATERPVGTSLDFRVYIEPDNFFSHEFADSTRWNCFRLTTRDGEETLFGYAEADKEVSKEILDHLKENNGMRTSMILRLTVPQGIQSRRGVVIEKMLSPRWLYLDPPDA